ncbi:hypothetical protein [uncultured Meiothermus sp.]|uniref:hypothetical protein n=1 Tax=uncultured Meiothermus sp. TaxID=157471 RepID=UPI0026261464|nr:hypothetical protein [uncultured Meiothermus sp.]
MKHRLYSGIEYDSPFTLIDRIHEALKDNHATDDELAVAKSSLEVALNRWVAAMGGKSLGELLAPLDAELERSLFDGDGIDVRALRPHVHALHRWLREVVRGGDQVLDYATEIIKMERTRAEIKDRMSNEKAKQQFLLFFGVTWRIALETFPPEQAALAAERLRRELMNPQRLDFDFGV